MIKIGSFQNLYVALPCAPRSLSRDELRRPERLPEFLNCHSCMNWTSGPWPWRHGWRWTGLGLPGLAPSILESISSFSKAFSQRSKRSMLEVTRHRKTPQKPTTWQNVILLDGSRWPVRYCQDLLGTAMYCCTAMLRIYSMLIQKVAPRATRRSPQPTSSQQIESVKNM